MKRKFSKFIFVFILILIFFSTLNTLAEAKESSGLEDIQSTSDFLTVTPPKVELWTEAGKTLTQSLMITNESDDTALIALNVESFSISDGDGSVVLGQNFSLPNMIEDWIEFDNKAFQLKSKETKIVNYKIKTPDNAYPGGSYAAIVVSMDKLNRGINDGDGAFAKVVSLVMLSVAGDIRDRAVLDQYTIQNSNIDGKNSFNFTLRVKNNGNNHIKPQGEFIITNMLGQQIGQVSLEELNVLPNTYRDIKTIWQPQKILFGRYNVSLIAKYGYKEDKQLTASTHFYSFPWWITLIICLVLIGLFLFICRLIKINRRRKTIVS